MLILSLVFSNWSLHFLDGRSGWSLLVVGSPLAFIQEDQGFEVSSQAGSADRSGQHRSTTTA
jgi:hypothetical protein